LDEVTAPERRVLPGGLNAPEVVGLEGETGLAEGALVRGVRRGRLRVHPGHLGGECTHLGYELRLRHTVSSFLTRKPPARWPGAAGTWLWARSGRQGQEEGRPEGRPAIQCAIPYWASRTPAAAFTR